MGKKICANFFCAPRFAWLDSSSPPDLGKYVQQEDLPQMPLSKIDNYGLGNTTGQVTVGPLDASAYGGQLSVTAAGQSSMFMWNAGIGSGHVGFTSASSNLKLSNTYADGIMANGKGIEIDTQGRVTAANQPYAYARCSYQGGYSLVSGQTHIMQYNSTSVNTGNCWNTSNYRFTCPTAGRYFVYAHAQLNGPSTTTWNFNFGIWRNGGIQDGVYESTPGTNDYRKVSVSGIVPAAANDYIDIRLIVNVSTGSIEYTSPDQRFACHIYLLG